MFGQFEQIEDEMRRLLSGPTDIGSQMMDEMKRRMGLETVHRHTDMIGSIDGGLTAGLAAMERRKEMERMLQIPTVKLPAESFDVLKFLDESGERMRLEFAERSRKRQEEFEKTLQQIREWAAEREAAAAPRITIIINLHGQQSNENAQNEYSN